MTSLPHEDTSGVQTLPGKLAAEISRVTRLRAQYEEAQRIVGAPANLGAAIHMMTASLSAAIAAAGNPDIERQIHAVRDLEGFTS